jgi:hypothetical protein
MLMQYNTSHLKILIQDYNCVQELSTLHATNSETEKYNIVTSCILVRVTAMEQYMLEGTTEVLGTILGPKEKSHCEFSSDNLLGRHAISMRFTS